MSLLEEKVEPCLLGDWQWDWLPFGRPTLHAHCKLWATNGHLFHLHGQALRHVRDVGTRGNRRAKQKGARLHSLWTPLLSTLLNSGRLAPIKMRVNSDRCTLPTCFIPRLLKNRWPNSRPVGKKVFWVILRSTEPVYMSMCMSLPFSRLRYSMWKSLHWTI